MSILSVILVRTDHMPLPPTILSLLAHSDPAAQVQGRELLWCFEEAIRWDLINDLLQPGQTRWMIAARCLLPPDTANDRMQKFVTLCAMRKLERERFFGRTVLDLAWQAVERAGMGVLAPKDIPLHWTEEEFRRDLQDIICCGVVPEIFHMATVDLEQVPSDWKMSTYMERHRGRVLITRDPWYPEEFDVEITVYRETIHEAEELIWLLSSIAMYADLDSDEIRQNRAAHRAAGQCCMAGEEDLDGQVIDKVPRADTLTEWQWQRQLWQRVVADGNEGLSMVYKYPFVEA